MLERGTFRVILKEDISNDANFLGARFILVIKSNVDGKIKFKVMYVIGGHHGRFEAFMVHAFQKIHPLYVLEMLALATNLGFDVWSTDVTQAHRQPAEPLFTTDLNKEPIRGI